ncbi:MAG: hypothetical protein HETSPECPRED_003042 [Heterodermia speciosa]|uniref:Aminoglycoside phosphotransferase domain-containing protein n=1 Tax=Heterodermia speciosa TaxID=116794 RepID=A0A8H3PHC6_9LECA|nr:MAG: hypothetical protein HETSPECPRED_003042 [Heterodermia speciosa]
MEETRESKIAAKEQDSPQILTSEADESDNESIGSDESLIEPYFQYCFKIERLLESIGLRNFSVKPIQHGYEFQNCVYALQSTADDAEQYILRVPVLPNFEYHETRCSSIENDAALLGDLEHKLPGLAPRVKAFDATKDNPLETPYTVQTRIPGVSLDHVYDELNFEEKCAIVDQFVGLLSRIESIHFRVAGTFSANPLRWTKIRSVTSGAVLKLFDEGPEEFVSGPKIAEDREGRDLKLFLSSHIEGWICQQKKEEVSLSLPLLPRLFGMLETLGREGAFAAKETPVVLNHWDLEPRNIMVEKVNDAWKICGVIDWDGAMALPRPLARRAPDWIWDYNREGFTGLLDNDHHPNQALSDESKDLKAYFDAKAAATLEGYLEDAYGKGVWLRTIWTFARRGAENCWYVDLLKKLVDDWDAGPAAEDEGVRAFWYYWTLQLKSLVSRWF